MNIFRLAGDMTHLMSIIVLLLKIHSIKSCAGTEILTLYSADRSSQCIPALWEIVLSLFFYLEVLGNIFLVRASSSSFMARFSSCLCCGVSLSLSAIFVVSS